MHPIAAGPFLPTFSFAKREPSKIHTLSLHDALPISRAAALPDGARGGATPAGGDRGGGRGNVPLRPGGRGVRGAGDRKSTRLNSSHVSISYAVFCLKKKNGDTSDHC